MEKIHRDIFRDEISSIIKNTDITILLPYLERADILPQRSINLCMNLNPEERKELVFKDIQKSGPNAFDLFLKVCLKTGHFKLHNILTKTSPNDGFGSCSTVEFDGKNLKRVLENPSADAVIYLKEIRQQIQVKCGTQLMDDPNSTKHKSLQPYSMRGKKRGAVLIINNKYFDDNKHTIRNGAEVDQAHLEELFGQLGFIIFIEENLTLQNMLKKFIEFIKDPILNDVDCCFVVVMSHGIYGSSVEETNVITYDDKLFPCYHLINYFNNRSCPALFGKPKVFLFQLCRGVCIDTGTPQVVRKFVPKDVEADGDGENSYDLATLISDVCVCYSSYAGFKSYRHRETGSWFIEKVCEEFMKHAHDTDVQEMLKLAARETKELATQYTNEKQTPEIRDILFNPCYLNPGLDYLSYLTDEEHSDEVHCNDDTQQNGEDHSGENANVVLPNDSNSSPSTNEVNSNNDANSSNIDNNSNDNGHSSDAHQSCNQPCQFDKFVERTNKTVDKACKDVSKAGKRLERAWRRI